MGKDGKKPSLFQRKAGLPATILLGILVVLLIWLPLPLNCGCAIGPRSSRLSTIEDLWNGVEASGYVAHALGGIDGNFYTNSREAFVSNYEKGFRTFEVDLVLLQDGSAFCAHDGTEWMYGLDRPFLQTTADELSGRACLGKYTPLTGSELLDLASEYTDAYFLVHTKRTAQGSTHDILRALVSEAEERHPSVLDRIIPRTLGLGDLRKVADIYPFRDYWVDVYCHKLKSNGSSGLNRDQQVVFYLIGHGSPTGLSGTMGTLLDLWGSLADPSRLRCPPLGPVASLHNVRLYISVDFTVE